MKPLILLWSLLFTLPLAAHDSWVEINSVTTEENQPVYASLMLGNHGNHHRDFKLASKIPLEGTTLTLVAPDRQEHDLKPQLIDNGLAEKEGFRSVRVTPDRPGAYTLLHTYEAIVHYAPKRVIRSGKAFFHAGNDRPGNAKTDWFSRSYGYPLELIPLSNPIHLEAGNPLHARLLFKGQPLKDAVVSCIPRGTTLEGEFDPAHQARTNERGEVTFSLREPNFYLVVAQQPAPEETGEGYAQGSAYSATMTLQVRAKTR